jgi:ribosomal protein S18 acetylase RimI-like enzyme
MDLEMLYDPLPSGALEQLVSENIIGYNLAQTGISDWHPANFFLRDRRGEWRGGLLGLVWGGWLHVRFLWVAEALRGQGHGTRLLAAAEAFAREHGATDATLETHSFQAAAFYRKLGYTVVGELTDYPPGHSKLFLRKTLSPAPAEGAPAAA